MFLGREWYGRKTSHVPRSKQIAVRKQFETFAAEVKEFRKDKQVKLVHDGDSIDGDHHHSGDVCTMNELEQADIHIELMQEFQKRIGWRAGDEMYYTEGTETHTHDYEGYIGREMNAVRDEDNDAYVWDVLKLRSNGVLSWWVHHGPSRGKGAAEGNPMRNWLRNIYNEAVKDQVEIPDILYTGHVHDPTYACYEYRVKMNFKVMHGIILPSWQTKTRFAKKVAAVSRNKIGGIIHEIKADGTITVPRFSVMETD